MKSWVFYALLLASAKAIPFFFNEISGNSQWNDPSVMREDSDGNKFYLGEDGTSTWELPEKAAWRIAYSDDYKRQYYYNEITRVSQWEVPEDLAWTIVDDDKTEL